MSPMVIVPSLNYLANLGLIFQLGNYYAIDDQPDWVALREKGNAAATKMMKVAKRYVRLISWFPFVRCVCISGSLSKGYVDEGGDVDYFVVTEPGRLWIARTLLIGFKKIFLLNSKKYFCINYLIDTNHLEIPDQNIFTATEIQTLLPMYDAELYNKFLQRNEWSKAFRPNMKTLDLSDVLPKKRYWLKGLFETLLSNSMGDALDSWMMKLTMKRWEKKFAHFNKEFFEHALRSRKYVSKHHPQNFQKRVLEAFAEGHKSFELKHNLELKRPND